MPELGVMVHSVEQGRGVDFVGDGILVAVTIVVVNKSCHADGERIAGDGVIGCSMGSLVIRIYVDTTVKIPNRW